MSAQASMPEINNTHYTKCFLQLLKAAEAAKATPGLLEKVLELAADRLKSITDQSDSTRQMRKMFEARQPNEQLHRLAKRMLKLFPTTIGKSSKKFFFDYYALATYLGYAKIDINPIFALPDLGEEHCLDSLWKLRIEREKLRKSTESAQEFRKFLVKQYLLEESSLEDRARICESCISDRIILEAKVEIARYQVVIDDEKRSAPIDGKKPEELYELAEAGNPLADEALFKLDVTDPYLLKYAKEHPHRSEVLKVVAALEKAKNIEQVREFKGLGTFGAEKALKRLEAEKNKHS